jgi:hypothetical protein
MQTGQEAPIAGKRAEVKGGLMANVKWIKRGEGRTLQVKIRLFTDEIAQSGEGYVVPGHAWFMGDVSFIPNPQHGIKGAGTEPIMFNRPEELVEAIIKAAKNQGVTLFERKTKQRLT